jgi:predicted NAD-dependent protein-ADP-ribosyltransferase YbiA (DUF1768 family)
MVQSQLNPSINFPEIRYVDKEDLGFKAPIYSLTLYKKPIIIALGQLNTNFQESSNLVYFPIYLIGNKKVVLQIGVYEFLSSNLSNVLDKTGDLDLELAGNPLIYSFIKSNKLQLTNNNEDLFKSDKVLSKIEEVDEDVKEIKDDAEKVEERVESEEEEGEEAPVESESEQSEEEESTPPGFKEQTFDDRVESDEDVEGDDERLKKFKTKKQEDSFEQTREEYSKEEKQYNQSKSTKWVEKYFINNNFDEVDNEGGGDCLFAVVRDGLETKNINKTVKELRIKLSTEATQELFQNYKEQYDMYKSAIDVTNSELQVLVKRNKELKLLLSGTQDRSEHKKILKEAGIVKKDFERLKEDLALQKGLLEEFKFMKNIKTLSDFKDFIQTSEYWADTWAISTIERLYNVKLIIFSYEEYNAKDSRGKTIEVTYKNRNIVLCGQLNDRILEERGLFEPTYYIMCFYNGVHYELITYKKKGAFTFTELPYIVKYLVVEKCLEGDSGTFNIIPEFKDYKAKTPEANIETLVHTGGGLLLENDPTNDLFDNSIEFIYYSGSLDNLPGKGKGEKISHKDINKFSKLSAKDNWRKKLSDLYVGEELEIDGKKWKTVEHYINGNKFKKGFPSFYKQFTLESNSSISKNPYLAKAAGSKLGKFKDKQLRPSHIEIDDIFETNLPSLLHKAYYTKFIRNPEMKELLKLTGKGKLLKYNRGKQPSISKELMKIRKLIKE